MDAAGRAEAVLDQVLVEAVGAGVVVGREQLQRAVRHEPQQRAPALADRAIAGHRRPEVSLDFESHLATVAASLVLHPGSPAEGVRSHGLFYLTNRFSISEGRRAVKRGRR